MPEATSLLIEEGGRVRRIKLESLPAVVGRDEACEVVLADPAASRRHLRLEAASLGLAAVDLGSSNGTMMDGARIKKVLLRRGAELRIGDAKITYLGGGADAAAPAGEDDALAALKRAAAARSVAESEPGRRPAASDRPNRADGADGETAAPAVPAPPVSGRTKAAANALSLVIIVALNLGAFYVFKRYTAPASAPQPPAYEAAPPRPVLIEGRESAPPDPDAAARAAWRNAAEEAGLLVADDRFDGAFGVIKGFLSTYGGSGVAGEAHARIEELRAGRDLRLRNCLDNAESQAKFGATATARKIMALAVKIAGSDPPERLAATEAVVAAAEAAAAAAASRPKPGEKK